MATWKPAPSVPAQAFGGDSPMSGKYPYGAIGTPKQQPPSPPWVGIPVAGAGSDGTDVFTTG